MKKYLLVCLLGIFFGCTNQKKSEIVGSKKNKAEYVIQVKDSLIFNEEGNIIDVAHFENNVREGFSLIFDEKTHSPKYLVEYNEGKSDKVIIAFYSDGRIKSFGSADVHDNSQKMKFHKNGAIKSIGNTIKGKGNVVKKVINRYVDLKN